MKLIDADAIPWDVEGIGDIPVVTREEIDDMPTVEAIPINWMLNDWNPKTYADVGYQVMRRIIADWVGRKERRMKEYIVRAPKTKVMAVEEYTSFYGEPVEELIRCKDCKWQGNETDCPMFDPKMMKVDDFCSYGERKEE